MSILEILLLSFFIVFAITACLVKNLTVAVIILITYSVLMAILLIILQSPDAAIMEVIFGAGITGLLFFLALRKIHRLGDVEQMEEDEKEHA